MMKMTKDISTTVLFFSWEGRKKGNGERWKKFFSSSFFPSPRFFSLRSTMRDFLNSLKKRDSQPLLIIFFKKLFSSVLCLCVFFLLRFFKRILGCKGCCCIYSKHHNTQTGKKMKPTAQKHKHTESSSLPKDPSTRHQPFHTHDQAGRSCKNQRTKARPCRTCPTSTSPPPPVL